MTKYQLSTRQICFFFLAFMPVTKIFMLPSIIAKTTSEDLWISTLLNFAIDIFTLIILLVIQNKTEKDVFTLLEDAFGKVASKFILVVYFIFLMLKAIVPINEQKDFIEMTLYYSLPSIFYFMPFYVTAFYLSTKKIKVLGKSADILWGTTMIGLALLIILSLQNTSFLAVLPIGANGIVSITKASYQSLNWFGDCLYFVFFLGKYKNQKHSFVKILLSYIVGALIVIAFMIIFYGVFTSIAFRQRFALTEVAKYTNVINNTGRIDYFAIILILSSHIISASLPLFFSSKLLKRICGFKQEYFSSIIVIGCHVFVTLFLTQFFFTIEKIAINYSGFIFLFFSNVLPLFTIYLVKRSKKNEKNKLI